MNWSQTFQMIIDAVRIMSETGQDNGEIRIEIRRGEPRHVRFDYEVKYQDGEEKRV